MSKEIKSIEEALKALKGLGVDWVKINRIENSLWDTGVAFFNRNHFRVAYYDEIQGILSIGVG